MGPIAIENGCQSVYDPVTSKPDNPYEAKSSSRENESTTETVKKTSATESVVPPRSSQTLSWLQKMSLRSLLQAWDLNTRLSQSSLSG